MIQQRPNLLVIIASIACILGALVFTRSCIQRNNRRADRQSVRSGCTPLPTCTFWSDGTPQVTPCGTPTPTLGWDGVPDTFMPYESIIAGYKLYKRSPGGTFQLLKDYPCSFAEGTRFCPGVDAPIPIQRADSSELVPVEYAVKAYDDDGRISQDFSDFVSICSSHVWVPGEPYN